MQGLRILILQVQFPKKLLEEVLTKIRWPNQGKRSYETQEIDPSWKTQRQSPGRQWRDIMGSQLCIIRQKQPAQIRTGDARDRNVEGCHYQCPLPLPHLSNLRTGFVSEPDQEFSLCLASLDQNLWIYGSPLRALLPGLTEDTYFTHRNVLLWPSPGNEHCCLAEHADIFF